MAILPLLHHLDPRLKKPAVPATFPIDRQIIDDLLDTLQAHEQALALAATQVGIMLAIFVRRREPQVVINPAVLWVDERRHSVEEGCLSYPGLGVEVSRPVSLKATYQDATGNFHEDDLDDLACRVFLHELDHLLGCTILDHADDPARALAALDKRERKLRRRREEALNQLTAESQRLGLM